MYVMYCFMYVTMIVALLDAHTQHLKDHGYFYIILFCNCEEPAGDASIHLKPIRSLKGSFEPSTFIHALNCMIRTIKVLIKKTVLCVI